jgi:hypothetical protein
MCHVNYTPSYTKFYQPAPGCPPAGAEPAGEDRLPLTSAGGSSGHLVHYGPTLWLAAKLEHE